MSLLAECWLDNFKCCHSNRVWSFMLSSLIIYHACFIFNICLQNSSFLHKWLELDWVIFIVFITTAVIWIILFIMHVYCYLRTLFHKTIMNLGRAICFFYGFQNVKVKGEPVGSDVAPMLVCAPHSTFMDAFVIFYCSTLPSSLSRKENSALPILGCRYIVHLIIYVEIPFC